MTSTPPSSLRTLGILARLTGRRILNQFGLAFGKAARKPSSGEAPLPRQATPGKRKSLGCIVVLILVGLWLVPSILAVGCMFGCTFVERLSKRLDPPPAPAENAASKPDDFDRHFTTGAFWLAAPDDRVLTAAVGGFVLLLTLGHLGTLLGAGKQDLGKGEWDMEWLFTFPVPARTLFFTRLIQYAFIGPFQAMFLLLWMPYLAGIYWSAGNGWWAAPLALLATIYLLLLAASLYLVAEVWLQKRLSPGGRKNVQAILGIVGGGLSLLTMVVWLTPSLDGPLLAVANAVPVAALANPFTLPALLCANGWPAGAAAMSMGLLAVAAPLGSVRVAEWLVRDGLLSTPGAYLGRRDQPAGSAKRGGLFRGIVGKELMLLLRDRAFLGQTLVAPAMLGGFYFLMYRQTATGLLLDPRHAATTIFGVGVYMLLLSASQILRAEGGALWLLYTFPRPLHTLLFQKTLMWAALAALYVVVGLGFAAAFGMPVNAESLAAGAVAVVGVVLMAVLIGALGVLTAEPSAGGLERRPSLTTVVAGALLAALYGPAIYAPPLARLAFIVQFALLGLALWQRVQDRMPYLLEPSAAPPRRLSLVHGLIAILIFTTLQTSLLGVFAAFTTLLEGTRTLLAFAAAGTVTALGAIVWLLDVEDLFSTTGLRSAPAEQRPTPTRALLGGALMGVPTALFGLAYLSVIDAIGVFPPWREAAPPINTLDTGGQLAVLALVLLAAPLIEEFLFRGLLYQGMRRTIRPSLAIVASAALFALLHPPISLLPVFVLGLATAFSMERYRWLVAPIATHVVYNGVVVAAWYLL